MTRQDDVNSALIGQLFDSAGNCLYQAEIRLEACRRLEKTISKLEKIAKKRKDESAEDTMNLTVSDALKMMVGASREYIKAYDIINMTEYGRERRVEKMAQGMQRLQCNRIAPKEVSDLMKEANLRAYIMKMAESKRVYDALKGHICDDEELGADAENKGLRFNFKMIELLSMMGLKECIGKKNSMMPKIAPLAEMCEKWDEMEKYLKIKKNLDSMSKVEEAYAPKLDVLDMFEGKVNI